MSENKILFIIEERYIMKFRKFFAAFLVLVMSAGPIFAQYTTKESKSGSNFGDPVPQYQIIDIGVVQAGDTASQGFGVSVGGVGVGRSFRTGGTQAFSWTQNGGIVGLTNLTGFNYCASNGANDIGFVVGTCATTSFGSGRQPVMWQNGMPMLLPFPAGETLGDANDVNASGIVVGSVNSGSLQRGVIYSGGMGSVIMQTTSGGSFFQTAFRINDSGRVVGQGIDPNNAARNVGMVYDIGSSSAFEVGALPRANGALAFDVSNTGLVVGSSMMNQGSGLPFIWSQASGMTAIPLPAGTSQGSARGVNSNGWAVGTASSAFAIPFLYDGTNTYRLQDIIPANSGWDLSMNTSSSALGISDGNVIVGTGVFNGQVHAYAMMPVTGVSLGGHVLMIGGNSILAGGSSIRNASVTISGGNLSAPVTTYTDGFGYYNFQGLQSGATYTVTVSAENTSFAQPTQMITLQTSVSNLDFTAEQ